ncbi:hypothetical protein STAS_17098 [Striga asiatica]|uniref:Uncharacterized protein n=1 Tax=Striga asiatica TaxID=4170 RepID=A0A5A7Q5B1_STRAF|nr:hypothetical protein STAS_17098 [Striga asiatica]
MEPARRCSGGSRLPECVPAERRLSMTCVDLIGKVPDRGFLDGARLRLAADQKARGWGLSGWLERRQLNRRSLVEEGSSGGAGAEVAARRWSYLSLSVASSIEERNSLTGISPNAPKIRRNLVVNRPALVT